MATTIITAVLLIPGLLVLATLWAIAGGGNTATVAVPCSRVPARYRGFVEGGLVEGGLVEVRLPRL